MVSIEHSETESEQDGNPSAVVVLSVNQECTIPDCVCQRNRRRAHNKLVSDKLSLGTTVKESVGEMSVAEPYGSPPAVVVPSVNHECMTPDCDCQRNRCRAHNKLVSDKLSLGITVKESVGEMSVAEPASEKTTQFSSGLHPLLSSTMTMISKIQCTSSGAAVHSEDHDIHINIPEGAILPGETLSIEVGVALFGPFVFPEETVPVSPIVWLCVTSADQQNYQFLKPVEITLPHCLDPSSGSSSLHHRRFLKANHTFSGEGDGFYSMLPTDGTAVFYHGKALGTLYTDHFCSFCIAERITEDEATAANFCMIMARPKRPQPPYDIYFGVMFCLATCIKVVYCTALLFVTYCTCLHMFYK